MPLKMTQTDQPALLALGAALTGSIGFADDAQAMAFRIDGGDPIGVAVFEQFRGAEAELHLGFQDGRRMTQEVVQGLQLFAFHPRALALTRVWVNIAADNRHAICTAVKMGFQIEYRKRGGFAGGKDAIVLSLQPAPAEAQATTKPDQAG